MILTEPEIAAVVEQVRAEHHALRLLPTKLANALESALLEKLRAGVEVPEPVGYYEQEYIGEPSRIEARFDHDQLLQYGDARALAAREQAIEECAKVCISLYESQAINDSDKAMELK